MYVLHACLHVYMLHVYVFVPACTMCVTVYTDVHVSVCTLHSTDGLYVKHVVQICTCHLSTMYGTSVLDWSGTTTSIATTAPASRHMLCMGLLYIAQLQSSSNSLTVTLQLCIVSCP